MFPRQTQLNQNPFQKTSTTPVDKSLSGLGGSIKSAISSFFKPKTPTGGGSLTSTSRITSNNFSSPTGGTTIATPVQNGRAMIFSTPAASQSALAIQKQVLNSPVTVNQMATAPVVPPPIQEFTTPTHTLGMATTTETPTAEKGGKEDTLSRILALTEQAGTEGEKTRLANEEFRLQEKQDTLNRLNARALSVDRDYEVKRRAIMENPEGKLTGALQGEVRNLERSRDQQLADIGIQQAIAQGDVTLANTQIKNKIDSEFEPIKNQIAGLEKYLTLFSKDLTDSEKILLENNIKQLTDQAKSGVEDAQLEQSASAYQQLLDSGQITADKIPKDVLGYMNLQGYVTPEQKQSKETATALMGTINKFFEIGATGAVGPTISKIIPAAAGFFGIGNYQADKSLVENIKAQLTLQNLGFLKGAMSDKDIAFITQASSSLNDKMSEGQFKKELINIQGRFVNGIVNSPAYTLDEKKDVLASQFLREDPKATDAQIAEMVRLRLQNFNKVGNTSASNIQIPKESRLAYVNNNPANLRYAGQAGATKGQGGFARFESPEAGVKALENQIKLDASRGLTLSQFINKFAPPTENDTQTYIKQVQQMTGSSPSTPISRINIKLLTKAMAKKESSTNIA